LTRVVLDANVLVSAVLVAAGNPARIVAAWRDGDVELLASPAILDEVARVLHDPRLQRRHGLDDHQIDLFAERVRSAALLMPGKVEVKVVPEDPTDDRYLACALEGGADYVVTGDEHLLQLSPWRGIVIVAPAAFVATELPGDGLDER